MTASNVMRLPLPAVAARGAIPVVGMYTPLWHAAKVLSTTAHSWWEGGVPPARKRSERATEAVAQMASSVVRHLKPVRSYRPSPTAY